MSGKIDLFADGIRRREKARRRKDLLWSFVSFFVHGAFFAAVILLTPAKSLIVPEREKPAADAAAELSADRIEDIGKKLTEARVNELLSRIQAMQAVLHNMDMMKEELAKDYDAFAEASAGDIRRELDELVAETARDQRDAETAQAAVRADAAGLHRLETRADLADATVAEDLRRKAELLRNGSAEKAVTAQANAVNALDRLQVKAEFAGFRKTAEAAESLRDAQMEAGRLQNDAQDAAVETASKLAGVAQNERTVAEQRKIIEESKAKIAASEREKAQADETIAREEAAVVEADRRRNARREAKDWEAARREQDVASAHRRTMEEAKRASRDAQHRMTSAKGAVARAEPRLADALGRREELGKVKREQATEAQLARLDAAAELQKRVGSAIEALKATLAADSASRERLAREDRRENRLVSEDAAAMTMTGAYELARELESAITESYKDVKATETAIGRRMSFAAAQKITDVAKPERLRADAAAIETKPRTKEALDRQKAAEAEVVREADNMVEATVAMMNEAMEIVMSGDSAPRLGSKERPRTVRWLEEKDLASRSDEAARAERMAAMEAGADHQVRLAAAAAEDSSAKAKDLAGLMSPQADGATAAGEGAAGGLSGAVKGPPDLEGGDLALVPGNVIGVASDRSGVPAKWMYVNSWYVIGPFPNPNRVNLRRRFPPESVVDLDATYVGKDGRVLRWTFCQAKNAKPPQPWMADWRAEVIPENKEEYSIFYAYAEVFFDCECDRWVAIGSDDRSDVWLNDMPIWGSSNRLKAWTLAEDFRRVHFRKGRNRILARIENGHWDFGWSVCIAVEDAEPPR